eukprot:CAMPEP_0172811990 /NCGR_PEP_ID=MMETSP1075-20121228/9754_1 /TAXON_ID=2916 /ORGANISM="Ceratium fusus, Strain PA161109" /LENGTH=704 /DNA_ID=CAMNT_0013651481 /DNA_START=22 /DNA_END=2137 /DNA_ORIENTATION=+
MGLLAYSTPGGPAGMSARSCGHPTEEDVQQNIFLEVVPFHIKPAGRDEFSAALTLRLQPDNAAHPRSLLLELTDELDLVFYHSLMLGEGDFHALKSEQRLLVDFQSFPLQLAELLRRCMDAGCTGAVPGVTAGENMLGNGIAGSAVGALRMLACLECSSGPESVLRIVESNQFCELTHLSLRLRRGTDEAVKQHLAGKLRICRLERSDLAERLGASEEALDQARRQVDELGARAHVVAEERQHLERSLEAKHQREITDLRQEHTKALAELQRTSSDERHRLEVELRGLLEDALARAGRAERSGEELQQQCEALTNSNRTLQGRVESAEAESIGFQQEKKQLQEQLKQSEIAKFQHEREIGELRFQLSSLKEQLTLKEQLVTNQMAQIEQSAAQRKGLEDALASARQQVRGLEERFALSAQEIAKGNQIIQNLHTSTKQAKAKLRLKTSALAQQEKAVLELERADELSKHVREEKEHELARSKEREARLQQDLEELRRRLTEAQDVMKSDQEVIEYLNRQLTDRDLKAIPSLPASTFGQSEPRGIAPGVGLAELLRRAETAGKGLHSGSSTMGTSLGTGLGSSMLGLGCRAAFSGTSTLGDGGGGPTAAESQSLKPSSAGPSLGLASLSVFGGNANSGSGAGVGSNHSIAADLATFAATQAAASESHAPLMARLHIVALASQSCSLQDDVGHSSGESGLNVARVV